MEITGDKPSWEASGLSLETKVNYNGIEYDVSIVDNEWSPTVTDVNRSDGKPNTLSVEEENKLVEFVREQVR